MGFEGSGCELPCPVCENGGICNTQVGLCDCTAGYTGTSCEESEYPFTI